MLLLSIIHIEEHFGEKIGILISEEGLKSYRMGTPWKTDCPAV